MKASNSEAIHYLYWKLLAHCKMLVIIDSAMLLTFHDAIGDWSATQKLGIE